MLSQQLVTIDQSYLSTFEMKEVFPFYSIGHFINEPKSQTEFEIMRFDQMDEPDIDDIHKHTFYEILWTETGKSKQIIDYKEYDVLPNSLFFISPNQVHQFEEWKPLKGGTILFTEDFFLYNHINKEKLFQLSFLDNFYTNPCLYLTAKEFTEIKLTIDLLITEQERVDKNISITQSLLHILLEQVQRLVNMRTKNVMSPRCLILFKQFRELLEMHYKENQTASFYADKLFVTQHRLNEVSNSATGKKASGVIKSRSILEAKRLLTFTDLTISQIASQLNYFDSSYFSKVFKSIEKCTPNDFKKTMSEKYRK